MQSYEKQEGAELETTSSIKSDRMLDNFKVYFNNPSRPVQTGRNVARSHVRQSRVGAVVREQARSWR